MLLLDLGADVGRVDFAGVEVLGAAIANLLLLWESLQIYS